VIVELKDVSCVLNTQCRLPKNQLLSINDEELEEGISKVEVEKEYSKILSAKIISSQKSYIVVQLNFSPFKPIQRRKVEITLVATNGCKWRVPVTISADPPVIDDTIVLESSMLETSELTFKLTNINKHVCQFQAYMEDSSDIVFDVEPKKGML
jgi:hypothetical protein